MRSLFCKRAWSHQHIEQWKPFSSLWLSMPYTALMGLYIACETGMFPTGWISTSPAHLERHSPIMGWESRLVVRPFPVFPHLRWVLSAFWRGHVAIACPVCPASRAVSTVFHDWRCRRIPWYQHRLQNENLIGLPKTWLLQWRGAHCGLGEIHSCAYRILLHISVPAPVWYTAGWFDPLLWGFPTDVTVHPVLVSLLCGLHEDENFVIFSEHRKSIHSGPFLPFVQWWSYLYPLSCSPCSSW